MASGLRVAALWGAVLVVVGVGATLTVDEPQELATEMRVLVRTKFIGPQSPRVNITAARMSLVGVDPLQPGHVDCDKYHNTVVVIDSKTVGRWRRRDEFDTSLAAQQCGALAVIRRQGQISGARDVLGFDFYMTDKDCCKSQHDAITIPFLAVWQGDIADAFAAAERGENVTLSIAAADTNYWLEDAYDHVLFVVFGRILLALANGLVALIGLRALFKHVKALRHARGSNTPTLFDTNRHIIIVAISLQVVGCTIRTFYCATGPFLSTASLTWLDHMVLINISMPIQLPVIVIVSYVFRRMVGVKRNVRPPRKRYVALIAAVCVAVLALEVLGGVGRAERPDLTVVAVFTAVWTFVVVFASLVLFLAGGLPFLWRLNRSNRFRKGKGKGAASSASLSRHSRLIRAKFARTVVLGSAGLLLQFVVLVFVAADPNAFFSPKGFSAGFILYYWGITVTALFHTLAFAPILRMRVLAESLKQSIAMRRPSSPNLEFAPPVTKGGVGDKREEHNMEPALPIGAAVLRHSDSGVVSIEKRPTPAVDADGVMLPAPSALPSAQRSQPGSNSNGRVQVPQLANSEGDGSEWMVDDLMDPALVLRVDPNRPTMGLRESIRFKAAQLQELLRSMQGAVEEKKNEDGNDMDEGASTGSGPQEMGRGETRFESVPGEEREGGSVKDGHVPSPKPKKVEGGLVVPRKREDERDTDPNSTLGLDDIGMGMEVGLEAGEEMAEQRESEQPPQEEEMAAGGEAGGDQVDEREDRKSGRRKSDRKSGRRKSGRDSQQGEKTRKDSRSVSLSYHEDAGIESDDDMVEEDL